MPCCSSCSSSTCWFIAGKLLTLPFDGNRSLLLRLGSRGIVAFTCPVGFQAGPRVRISTSSPHPDHPRCCGQSGSGRNRHRHCPARYENAFRLSQRLPGGMLLTALGLTVVKMQRLHGLCDIKHHLADADHFPAIFIPGRRAGDHKVRAKLFCPLTLAGQRCCRSRREASLASR